MRNEKSTYETSDINGSTAKVCPKYDEWSGVTCAITTGLI